MKKHILLVDDDEDDVIIFMVALKEVGLPCKCTWAKSGEQAVKQLVYLTPDIIFLDINMPGMNGLECLAEIRQIPRLQHIPVVLRSSGPIASYREKGIKLGASACLEKPDTGKALAEIIYKLIPGETIAKTQNTSISSHSHLS